jgi:hypothetical protein
VRWKLTIFTPKPAATANTFGQFLGSIACASARFSAPAIGSTTVRDVAKIAKATAAAQARVDLTRLFEMATLSPSHLMRRTLAGFRVQKNTLSVQSKIRFVRIFVHTPDI